MVLLTAVVCSYEPVALEPGRYRRQRVYLARLMLHPYIVENFDCPPVQGAAGTYLVQDFGDSGTGHVTQRVVSVTDFQKECATRVVRRFLSRCVFANLLCSVSGFILWTTLFRKWSHPRRHSFCRPCL